MACVVNAAHCGRVHCYVTGPLYLLAAIATLLAGMEFVPLRSSWIGGAVVGGTILAYVPEWVRGEPAAHLVNPPHRLAVGREQEDGAVVDDDLHVALVVLERRSSYWIGSPASGLP